MTKKARRDFVLQKVQPGLLGRPLLMTVVQVIVGGGIVFGIGIWLGQLEAG